MSSMLDAKIEYILRAHCNTFGLDDQFFEQYFRPLINLGVIKATLIFASSYVILKTVIIPIVANVQNRKFVAEKLAGERRRRKDNFSCFEKQLTAASSSSSKNAEQHALIINLIKSEGPSAVYKQLQAGNVRPVDVLHAYQALSWHAQNLANPITEFLLEAERYALELEKRGPSFSKLPLLYGVVLSVKERFPIHGTESNAGLVHLLNKHSSLPEDSYLVQVLMKHGAIPLAKTNTPQSNISFACTNPIYGLTENPYQRGRTPGGSSGGEGCLLAFDGSMLGLGSDIGGSIRIPAAFSGLCGLKPTCKRLGNNELLNLFSVETAVPVAAGFLSKDVDMIALGMHAALSDNYLFSKDLEIPPIPFRNEIYEPAAGSNNSKSLTFGWYDDDGYYPAMPAYQRALALTRQALERQGHRLVHFMPPDAEHAHHLFFRLMKPRVEELFDTVLKREPYAVAVRRYPRWLRAVLGDYLNFIARRVARRPAGILRATRSCLTAEDFGRALAERTQYKKLFMSMWKEAGIDLLLSPAFGVTSPQHEYCRDLLGPLSYTTIYNVIDFPAGVVPVTNTTFLDDENLTSSYITKAADGDLSLRLAVRACRGGVNLPVAVQVVGLPYQEELVLRGMKAIQQGVQYVRPPLITKRKDSPVVVVESV